MVSAIRCPHGRHAAGVTVPATTGHDVEPPVAIDVGDGGALHAPLVDRMDGPLVGRHGRTGEPAELVPEEIGAGHVGPPVAVEVAEGDVVAVGGGREQVLAPPDWRVLEPRRLAQVRDVERIPPGDHVDPAVQVQVAHRHRRSAAELEAVGDERRREFRVAIQEQVLVAAHHQVGAPVAVDVAGAHALGGLRERAAGEVVTEEHERRVGRARLVGQDRDGGDGQPT